MDWGLKDEYLRDVFVEIFYYFRERFIMQLSGPAC